MLDQATHWLEIAGTIFDALLLARVLLLRLNRVYVFITLACLLAVFFDAIQLWVGDGSPASFRVFLYSRFLYAFLFPLTAWDVFEELKAQVAKLRKLAVPRLVASLFLTAIFGLIFSAFVENNDMSGEPAFVTLLAIVLWAGSCSATLSFLWSVNRQMRAQAIPRPHNTSVWMVFIELDLVAELAACLLIMLNPLVTPTIQSVLNVALLIFGIAITAWCTVRLRSVAPDMPSARENASL